MLTIESDVLDGVVANARIQGGVNCPGSIVVNRQAIFGAEPFSSEMIYRYCSAGVIRNRGVKAIEFLKNCLSIDGVNYH